MRRKFDYMLPGDLKTFVQDFDTTEEARKMCRLAKKVVPNSRVYVRKGNRFICRCFLSSDAWVMTIVGLESHARKLNTALPRFIRNVEINAVDAAKHHRTYYPTHKGKRLSCRDVIVLMNAYLNS